MLSYIGQTGRSLRHRLYELQHYTHQKVMPYNDPHTAAPNHWAWRQSDNLEFECSAAPFPGSRRLRIGFEHYLLWQYRCEHGESPLCNLGRFHPNYSRPGNRSTGRCGKLLHTAQRWGGPSHQALREQGDPQSAMWMGLNWVLAEEVDLLGPGLYKILDKENQEVLYIGQSNNLVSRLRSYRNNVWQIRPIVIWVTLLPTETADHQRLELENDLLGAFYSKVNDLPKFQLTGNLKRNGLRQ